MRCSESLRAGPFIIENNAENEQVPEELEIEIVEPSAPVVIEAAVLNEECPKEIIDLPRW